MKRALVYIENDPAFDIISEVLLEDDWSKKNLYLFILLKANKVSKCLIEIVSEKLTKSGFHWNYIDACQTIRTFDFLILDWGSGCPINLLQKARHILTKNSDRYNLIKQCLRQQVPVFALPHGIALNKEVLFDESNNFRKTVRKIIHGKTLDFSDRNVFTKIIFFNKTQAETYIRDFGIYKHKVSLINPSLNKQIITKDEGLVGLSMPKLKNSFDKKLLIDIIKSIADKEGKESMILIFHPREDKTLVRDWVNTNDLETLNYHVGSFRCISNNLRILYDFGSSIVLTALNSGIQVRVVNGIMSKSLPQIICKNYTIVNDFAKHHKNKTPSTSSVEIILPKHLFSLTRPTLGEIINQNTTDFQPSKFQGRTSTFVNLANIKLFSQNFSLDSFDCIYSDGILLTLLLRLTGKKISRFSFDRTSLADPIISNGVKEQSKIVFFGGTHQEALDAKKNFSDLYNYNQIFCFDGYSEDTKIIKIITKIRPDILVLSLGFPKQERIALQAKKVLSKSKIYTSGAFISQSTKSVNYYPKIIDFLDLRWLYRALKHSHVRKRLFYDYPINVFWALTNWIYFQNLANKISKSEKLLVNSSK